MKRTLEFVIDCGQENMDVRTFVRRYLGFSARILTALKYEGEMLKNGEPVHMAHLGHPVAGDDLYGGHLDRTEHQMLCCRAVHLLCPALDIDKTVVTDFSAEQKACFPELFQ